MFVKDKEERPFRWLYGAGATLILRHAKHSVFDFGTVLVWQMDFSANLSLIEDEHFPNDCWWLPSVLTEGPLDHPHQRARHPNGTLGMVVNPSIDRL
jgi:hypothetical protein